MQEKSWKYFSRPVCGVLTTPMKDTLERTVFTVMRDGDAWAVELRGAFFGHASDKEVAKAFALKRAREVVDGGGAAQVRVHGEGAYR
jgi:hypothetical protein